MNRTTLILIASAATGSLALSSRLPAQARAISVSWSTTVPPAIINYGAVKVALNPPQGEWNAVLFVRSSAGAPWVQTYYNIQTAPWAGGKTMIIGMKAGPSATLPAVQLRIQNKAAYLEHGVGMLGTPTTTAVANTAPQGGFTLALGNFETPTLTAIWSGLDSVVKTVPSLRDLSLNERPAETTPTMIAHVESGQTVLLDGGRRLVVVGGRLVLMSGTQYQNSWPAATSWVLKTADQRISVLERVGYMK
jgi:hypothetical protein